MPCIPAKLRYSLPPPRLNSARGRARAPSTLEGVRYGIRRREPFRDHLCGQRTRFPLRGKAPSTSTRLSNNRAQGSHDWLDPSGACTAVLSGSGRPIVSAASATPRHSTLWRPCAPSRSSHISANVQPTETGEGCSCIGCNTHGQGHSFVQKAGAEGVPASSSTAQNARFRRPRSAGDSSVGSARRARRFDARGLAPVVEGQRRRATPRAMPPYMVPASRVQVRTATPVTYSFSARRCPEGRRPLFADAYRPPRCDRRRDALGATLRHPSQRKEKSWLVRTSALSSDSPRVTT